MKMGFIILTRSICIEVMVKPLNQINDLFRGCQG